MRDKKGVFFCGKVFLTSVFASTFFFVINVSAYTVTFNSTFGEFEGGSTTNVVEYNENHEVVNGTYKEPTFNNGTDSSNFITWYSEYDAKNRVNLEELSEDTTVYAAYEKVTWRWGFTNGEQTMTLPIKAGLQLKVWGAQGRTIVGPFTVGSTMVNEIIGGYGGYATGLYDFNSGETIYINVGGTGSLVPINSPYTKAAGGYNGGGDSYTTDRASSSAGGGGGATHIATKTGLLSSLANDKGSIAIVAGGGGGKVYSSQNFSSPSNQAHGGGYTGNGDSAGTQLTGYAFGQGFNAHASSETYTSNSYVGSGGGYFGGITVNNGKYGSSGGSGYIGNSIENTRYMAGYSVATSDTDSIKTILATNASEEPVEDYAKLGNGYAMAELTRLNIRYINEFDGTDFTKDQYVGGLAQNLSTTQRPGYSVAWYNGDEIWDMSKPVNFDMTLEAKYTPIVYTLTYNLGTGTLSEANPASYTIESESFTLRNPAAADYYEFIGWSGTGLYGNRNTSVTIPSGSINNREYTANYLPIQYGITYQMNGGQLQTTPPTEYNYESDEINIGTPTRKGYTFIGWSGTELEGNTNQTITIPVQSHGNRIYTANWSINQYTATFDVNGGSEINPTTRTSDYGVAFGTLPETSIKGYNFLGWFTEETGGERITSATTMPAEDHTYYAHWELAQYTITYVMNGHTNVDTNPTSYNVHSGEIVLSTPTPKAEWFYFLGWTTNPDTEEDMTEDFVIPSGSTSNITLYAIFQQNPYTIEFECEDFECDFEPITRVGEEAIGELPVPDEREGYIFQGWFINDKKLESTSTPRSNATAIAKWEKVITPETGDNIAKVFAIFLVSSVVLACVIAKKNK